MRLGSIIRCRDLGCVALWWGALPTPWHHGWDSGLSEAPWFEAIIPLFTGKEEVGEEQASPRHHCNCWWLL